jgi:uncharacterized membrane protein YeaQ/YmgE (transglycosylase-associated protein family)
MHWIWFILVGALVGALGRLLHPGRDAMGWLLTIAIGIVSMVVAAIISSGWLAFAIGVVVAVILVALVGRVGGSRTTATHRPCRQTRTGDASGRLAAPSRRFGYTFAVSRSISGA